MLDLAPYRKRRPRAGEPRERSVQVATIRFRPAEYERVSAIAHAEDVSLNSLVLAATMAAVAELEQKHAARHAG